MMYQTVAESDAAEERRRRREEAREIERSCGTEPVATNAAQPTASLKDPSWRERLDMRGRGEDLESTLIESPKPTAFTLVGELPTGNVSRAPQIPRVRTQLIEFAKQNTGQWIHYEKSTADPFKSVDTFGGQVRRGQGGFGPGFEAAVRSKRLYVRYVGEQTE